jgi:hypothetical protein
VFHSGKRYHPCLFFQGRETTNGCTLTCGGRHDTQHNDTQHNGTQYCYAECHYAKCRYAECRDYLNAMLSVVRLNVVMPSVVRLNVVMLSVVAPPIGLAPALMTRLGR